MLAFICDDYEIQQLLQQVLIVNKHTVTQTQVASVRNTLSQGGPCVLLHETSAWCTVSKFKDVLKFLGEEPGTSEASRSLAPVSGLFTRAYLQRGGGSCSTGGCTTTHDTRKDDIRITTTGHLCLRNVQTRAQELV